MMTLEAAREIVSSEGWLSQTPPAFRRALLGRCHMQHFRAGERIYAVGDEPGGLYGLVEGALRITIAPGSEGPFFAHILRPGVWMGEGPALSDRPRIVGLSAGRDSDVLSLPLSAIHAIMDAQPAFWRFLGLLALIHAQTAMLVMNDLMIRDNRSRCIATLLRLGDCRHPTPTERPPICIDASQEELAAMANLSRTTVSAILRRLEAAGAIATDYGRVLILQPARLRDFLGRLPGRPSRRQADGPSASSPFPHRDSRLS